METEMSRRHLRGLRSARDEGKEMNQMEALRIEELEQRIART
jgi:hypothetical protein